MGTRDMLGAICARCITVVAIVALLVAWTLGEAHAQQFTVGDFTVNFLGNAAPYTNGVPPAVTDRAMDNPAQQQAVLRAVQFWAERLGMNTAVSAGGGGPIVINVGFVDAGDPNNLGVSYSAETIGNVPATKGNGFVLTNPQATLTGWGPAGGRIQGADGYILFNSARTDYTSAQNTQRNVSADTGGYSIEATMIHELGHSLGIAPTAWQYDVNGAIVFGNPLSLFEAEMQVNGRPVTPGASYLPALILGGQNQVTYVGANALAVYGDGWIPPASGALPVENNAAIQMADPEGEFEGGSDLAHPRTDRGIMNAVETIKGRSAQETVSSRPFFSEAELALMKDLGHDIELRDFFGRSINQSNHAGVIVNTQGFGVWTGANYNTNQANMSTFGIGLHIIGANNSVVQNADLNSAGYAGCGIRIENSDNQVWLNRGRVISAMGDQGIGVMFTEDTHTVFTHRGTINANGNGFGMYFDQSAADEVNITGTITAGNAIYLSPNSQVLGGISFMQEQGATLAVNGDIVGNTGLTTDLRFGGLAASDGQLSRDGNGNILVDPNFNFTYGGSIRDVSPNDTPCFNLRFMAGRTTMTGAYIQVGRAQVDQGARWDVSGDVTASTVINAGVLKTTGSIVATGMVTNTETGFLWASGSIFANGGILNQGSIAMASPTPEIVDFGGTFTNAPTGTLYVKVDPPAGAGQPVAGVNNDQYNIVPSSGAVQDGKAILQGGSMEIAVANPANLRIGQVYTPITTQNGLTVQTEPLIYDDIPLLGFFPVYDGRNFMLEVDHNRYGPYGHTYNQRAFGSYFDILADNIVPGSELWEVAMALDALKGRASNYVNEEALMLLDQMSGSIYGSIASRGVQNTTIMNQTLAGVLRRNEFLPSSGDGYTAPPNSPKPRWNIWSVGYDFGGDTMTDHNAFGYNENLGGTLVGMDCEAMEDLRVGAYFAYGDGRMSAKGLSESNRSTELTYGAYLRRQAGVGYLLLTGGAGYNDYSTDRYLSFANRLASSKHGADKATVYTEYGIDFTDDHSTFQPFFGMQYAGVRQGGIQENGAGGYDLTVNKASADSCRTMVGSRIGWNLFPTARGKVAANAQAMWMYDVINKPFTPVTARLSDSDPGINYTVRGNSIGRNWAVLGTGLNWDIGAVRLSGGYDAYLNGYQAIHSGNAAVTIGW